MSWVKQQLIEAVELLIDMEFTDHAGVSTKAAAEILGVHEQTVRRWIKQGKLKCRGTGAFRVDMRSILRAHRAKI